MVEVETPIAQAPATATPDPAAAPAPTTTAAPETPPVKVDAPPATPAPVPDPVKPSDVKPEAFNLKLSENSLLKPEHLTAVETFAKSQNMTAKQAQELLAREELNAKSFHETQATQAKAEVEAWRKQNNQKKQNLFLRQ